MRLARQGPAVAYTVALALTAVAACDIAPEMECEWAGCVDTGGAASRPSTRDLQLTEDWLVGEDVDAEALQFWLTARKYREWSSSAGVAPSSQGGSRVFVSDGLAESLAAGAAAHPVGAVAVRELYEDDLVTLRAINLTLRRRGASDDAGAWLFVELSDLARGGAYSVFEPAAPGCVACHGAAPDSVQSRWPLRGR